jgi:hypothetical protein
MKWNEQTITSALRGRASRLVASWGRRLLLPGLWGRVSGGIRVLRVGLIFGAVISGLPVTAFAQAGDDGPRLNIGVTATTSYDDNVFRLDNTSVTAPTDGEGDFRFSPAIVADISQPMGRHNVFLAGSLGYDFYRKNSRLNRERITINGGGRVRVGPGCYSNLSGNFSQQQSDFADVIRITNGANRERSAGFEIGFGCDAPIGIRPLIEFSGQRATNNSQILSQNNYTNRGVTASIGYAAPALGEVGVYANYNKGSYPQRQILAGAGGSEKIQSYGGGLRYSRDIGRSLRGSVSLGYSVVDPNLAGVRRYKGGSWSADVTFSPGDQLRMNLGLGRSVDQSNLLGVSYAITDSYSLSGSYALNQQLSLSFGGSRQKRDLRQSPLLPAFLIAPKDKTSSVFGGLNYRPPGRISFAFDLRHTKRNSAVRQLDYGNTIAALTIRYGI